MEKYSGKAELMSTNSENRGEEISHLWMWFVLGVCLFFSSCKYQKWRYFVLNR